MALFCQAMLSGVDTSYPLAHFRLASSQSEFIKEKQASTGKGMMTRRGLLSL